MKRSSKLATVKHVNDVVVPRIGQAEVRTALFRPTIYSPSDHKSNLACATSDLLPTNVITLR